jgi:hypothetical protein
MREYVPKPVTKETTESTLNAEGTTYAIHIQYPSRETISCEYVKTVLGMNVGAVLRDK